MPEPVRVGLISTSWWADEMHIPSIQSHPQAALIAICGRQRERAVQMAARHQIPQVYTDYREMLARADLDALVVATPEESHAPIALAALERGLHVLCEKPMALDLEQAQAMVAAAERAGVVHMVYFTNRWLPHMRLAKELIEGGYLGHCYQCQFRNMGGYGRAAEYRWKWDRRRALGMLGDLGSHMIDLAHWFLGDIARVHGRLATLVARTGPDGQPFEQANDAAWLSLEFASGTVGQIQVSAVAHLGDRIIEQQLLFYGDQGTLEVNFSIGHGYTVVGARGDEPALRPLPMPAHIIEQLDLKTPTDLWPEVFTRQPAGGRHFVDAILGVRSPSPTFADGLKVQAVMAAAMESDRTGCWVELG